MLTLNELVSGYPGKRGIVVQPVSLSLQPGAFVCIIGRNGAGKSTLMRTISGLQPALDGNATLDSISIAEMSARERAQAISVVTTEKVSSPGMLARDVVELGRQPYTDWHGQLTREDNEIIQNALQQTDTAQLASTPLDSLSDGQRQRIMIARALAQSSRIMVLDEITAFLDLPGRVQMMALLRKHALENGKIVLLSSHDLELSLELCDQLWIVYGGQLHAGSPDEMIAQGIVANAFETEDVMFNNEQRRFVLR